MGLLNHQMLQIIKGIPAVEGDTDSAELPLVAIDLLDSGSGISLDLDSGWEPNIPSLKNGGIWADSPLTDGRTPIAGSRTNVTETMRLIVSTQTGLVFAATFGALAQMIQDINDFADTGYQIEPICLAWWAEGAPGPQYALIFNIDIDFEPADSEEAQAVITLSIEREPYWRGHVSPGENPKKWTYEGYLGQPFNASVAGLNNAITDVTNLVEDLAVNNRVDYNSSSKQTYLETNFIDIPGTAVPGDAPALVQLRVDDANVVGVPDTKQLLFGRFSPKRTAMKQTSASAFFAQSLSFNAADMTAGTNATIEADTGAPTRQSNGTASRGKFTPADNNAAIRFTVANRQVNNHRGKFAAFLRARQHSGAQNDLSMWLVYGQNVPIFQFITLPAVHPIRQDGTGNTSFWPFTYMGVVDFPPAGRSTVRDDGLGASGVADLIVQIWSQRTAGTTAVLYYSDLVLIPIDEPSGYFLTPATLNDVDYIFDNTGYYLHGSPGIFAGATASLNEPSEYRGGDITLLPGIDQRLYFFTLFGDGTSAVNWSISVSLNIVPRWMGIRDA